MTLWTRIAAVKTGPKGKAARPEEEKEREKPVPTA
jgi:hypothetical protein